MEHDHQNTPPTTDQLSKPWTWKRVGSTLIKLGLGVLAIYIIINKVDLPRVWKYMQQVHAGWLLLAFAGSFVSKIFASFRINRYYQTQSIWISDWVNFRLNLLTMFYNLFLPIVGGEVYKIYWLKQRYKTTVKQLTWSFLLDRISGLAALVALAILLFQFSHLAVQNKTVFLLGIGVLYLSYHLIHGWLFKSYHSAWWKVNGYAVVVQIVQAIIGIFIMLSLGITDNLIDYLVIFLLSAIAQAMPFIGARELTFVFGAELAGLNPELSLAISLFFYLTMAFTSLCGVYFMLFPTQLKWNPPVEMRV